MALKMRPLNDRVIVKRASPERILASGIVIPEMATEKPDQGMVVAVGTGKILEDGSVREMSILVGDCVLFGQYSGQMIKVNNEDLLVMREEDVIGIIENAINP